ncbi:FxsB family cyclophane-forming radical SAM/SPASM peptide maturase [Micromonospora sp. WMMA1363]|uniref:FxsB family cyclophane-forming radical SAM/SPASM peptide maturase n=1 Tax=Micromonospora sp. WMMA1363 TaxID=3053985 RepID=UPI00259CEE9B|nr:FxsB family cyclophane-forming radical SAM/SPASM peptide maturase [Micromonospora sp. WMMA1363]MDM4719040.1 FxsB family cyclophane-forming radical SAM/SPASM peptide maturase [Micromonospora sp. WMMA1363]
MLPPSALRSDAGEPATNATPGRSAPATTLSQYVLKIVSRCDLSCDHCYVYEHPDQSWRRQPRTMASATVTAAAQRIAEHATAHRLDAVRVVLHGGEPLLAGAAALAATAAELRRRLDPVTRLDLRMQSNGVLLTEEIAEVLVTHGVAVGVSLDGDRAANDRHRRYASGVSSHGKVLRALALLRRPEYRPSYAGLLCTVDIDNDPGTVYRALLAEEPPHIDFLLPHANWDRPPPRPAGATPYADWLLAVHRAWTADGRPVPIRLLDSLLATAAGGTTRTEAVGLAAVDLAVIETDGSYQQVDSLKSAYDGAPATGLDVFTHPVDAVAVHPMIAVRQAGLDGLCATCRGCPVVRQCGGGLFAHRYRTGAGFDNPSAYCVDLARLIRGVTRDPLPAPSSAAGPDATPAATSSRASAPPETSALPGPAGPDPAMPPASGPSSADRPVVRTVENGAGPDALDPAVLDDLGTGRGTDASVRQLAAVHLAKTRALLVALSPAVAGHPVAAAAWDRLVELDVTAPAAVREVLAHPFVRRWAHRCLEIPALADLGHLASVAAAAAVRARAAVDLVVPVRDGVLSLPTLGALALPGVSGPVTLSPVGGGFVARVDGRTVPVRPDDPAPGWRPARWLDGHGVLIEDTDPYRDCYQDLVVAPRLPADSAARLGGQLTAALRRVDTEVAAYAPGVRALLRAVVPLRRDRRGRQRSAAAASAFGAVAVTAVPDDTALVVLLVHEVQHVKLDGVLDVCELVDRRDARLLTVPWRDDPRPVEGVLHGTYAHLAVADVWRRRPGPEAAAHHRRYRDWTDGALDALLGLGVLTPAGERFATRMRATVDRWR